MVAAIVVLVAAAGAVAGVRSLTRDSKPKPPALAATGATGAVSHSSFLQRVVPAASEQGPEVPRTISDLANRLPLERKVAQLFLVGFIGTGTNLAPGQISYFTTPTDTYILFGTDADTFQEMTIRVVGVHTVDASWFVF